MYYLTKAGVNFLEEGKKLRAMALAGLALLPGGRAPDASPDASPDTGTDLKTAIHQYQNHSSISDYIPSTIQKRAEAEAKRAAIAKRDKRDQGTKRVLQRHYGFGDDGKMLSRAEHLKSWEIFNKSAWLRARGPR